MGSVTALLLAGLGVPAVADSPALEVGAPLATRPQTGVHGGTLAGATDTIVATTTRGDDGLLHHQLIRTADGTTIRTVRSDSAVESWTLVGGSIVTVSVRAGGFPGDWTVIDAASGTVTTRMTLPAVSSVLRTTDEWVLARAPQQSDGSLPLEVIRPDGSTTIVKAPDGSTLSSSLYGWTGGDDQTAYVSAFGYGDLALDPATGTTTAVTSPIGGGLPLTAVTSGRLYFWAKDSAAPAHFTVAWRSRSTGATGSFTVPAPSDSTDLGLMTLGDGLAKRNGASASDVAVSPVSTTDGTLGAPFLQHVSTDALLTTPDGRIVAISPGDPAGTVRVATPGTAGAAPAVASLVMLPTADVEPTYLGLSGDVVSAAWDDGSVRTSPAAGGAWSLPITGAGTGALDEAGDVVRTRIDATGTGSFSYRLTWPGGTRDISADSDLVLGHGGLFVSYVSPGAGSTYHVEEARTGTTTAISWSSGAHIVDGSRVWDVESGRLVPTDVVSGQRGTGVAVPTTCASPILRDVRGTWALLGCSGGDVVVDLTGASTPWAVPVTDARLGNGFVAWATQDVPRADVSTDATRLRVVELAATHREHDYGPIRPIGSGGTSFVVGDTGTRALAYVDELGRIRYVDASWTVPPPVDRTAPALAPTSGTSGVLRTPIGTVTFTASASDPSGVASYELRSRFALRGGPLQPWTVAGPLATPSVSKPLRAAMTRCYSFRATDTAGNVSAWSPARCTTAPSDDIAWSPTGVVHRVRDRHALRDAFSVLSHAHSALTMPNELGGDVTLWAMLGPGRGRVTVTVGGRVLRTVSLSGGRVTPIILTVTNPHHWTGPVRFWRHSGVVRLDAAAVTPSPSQID